MTASPNRRTRGLLAALAVAACLTAGCTAGDWDYDAPPAAGVQTDLGPIKARNLMAVTDGSKAVILGTLVANQDAAVKAVQVAPEQADGKFGEPVAVDLAEEIKANTALKLDATNATVDAEVLPGRLVKVGFQMADGSVLVLDVPTVSAEHPDYADAFKG